MPTERWKSLHISPPISSSLLTGGCLWEPDMLLLPSHPWKPTLAEWTMCHRWPLDDSGGEAERSRRSWMLSECTGTVSYDCRQSYWLNTNSICYSKSRVLILSIFLSSNFKQHLLYCWRCGETAHWCMVVQNVCWYSFYEGQFDGSCPYWRCI